MESNNLTAFSAYLSSNSVVNAKYAPYYVRWVSACYDFVHKPLSEVLTKAQKDDFLRHFAKNHEDWQVKQAEAALRLYDYYLSGVQTSAKQKSPQNIGEWNIAETNTQTAMRLRHMSYSTEKTYLLWLRSFAGFIAEKIPNEVAVSDIQKFLSYLAVDRKVSASTQNQALKDDSGTSWAYQSSDHDDIHTRCNKEYSWG